MKFAIIGAAIKVPGATDIDLFRAELDRGATHFESVSRERALASGLNAEDIGHANYVGVASPLPGAEDFDREFFRMSAAEARWTDPQQRLLLTLTHQALESGGIATGDARIGSYVTVSESSYLRGRVDRVSTARVDYQSLIGNDRDFAAARLAYRFGFTGPALTIQSACSSSLVALHQACAGLAFGDADIAVVGAASLSFPQPHGYIYETGGIMSPTGSSRPFDAESDGTVRGSGGGVVVLRRLEDALAQGDPILAVVAGSAINNDGAQRMAFSAPAVSGQVDVLTAALRRAAVSPDDIGYLEAHGTGTQLGDPIEFRALTRAYADTGGRTAPCHLGSAKANLGHLDAAAGMIGLLKTILTLDSGRIFPQPGYRAPNPAIPLDDSIFTIATESVPSPDLRYAGVSSFGMGGTNAHVILERAPRPGVSRAGGDRGVRITLSARSEAALRGYRARLAAYLRDHVDLDPADIAATLDARTRHPEATWTTHIDSVTELVDRLHEDTATREPSGPADRDPDGISNTGSTPVTRQAKVVAGDPGAHGRAHRIWLPPAPLAETFHGLPLRLDDPARVSPNSENDAEASAGAATGGAPGGLADTTTSSRADAAPESEQVVTVSGRAASVAVPGGVEADVRELFLRLAGEELGAGIDEGTDFFAAGGESIALVAIVGKVTDRIPFAVDFGALDGITTVGELGRALAGQAIAAAGTRDGLLAFGSGEPMIHLFPPAGGTNYCYAALSRMVPEIGLAAFRAPHPAGGSIEEIAAACVEDLCRAGAIDDRLVLGGYSFGGNVAFEIARQLQEGAGVSARHVIMFDSFAPDAFGGLRVNSDQLATEVEGRLRTATAALPGYRPGADTDRGGAVVLDSFREVWLANTRALDRYRPVGRIAAPITVLRARQPLSAPRARALGIDLGATMSWQRHTRGTVRIIDVPGDHYTLFTDPAHVAVVAKVFAQTLRSVHSVDREEATAS
ncbi:beta-ketoacyl synthase N-terminal-like domain-containing protein [Nocardia sp. NPDC052001]|uniref:beta-ketoacyl synthase N-terminal-like domain-containing protein n=1 Tax=Nocardia sp. NPDC052001 TaxID=3154853 RepID=UPI003427241E